MPPLSSPVVDRAGVLAADTRARLAQQLLSYEQEHGHQIVVHTTPSLEDMEIEDYSIRIAEAWKIGHKGLDNGVILTVAPGERKVRIEVGYGLEGVLPDAIAHRIVQERILPAFRAGELERGVVDGTRAIMDVARGEKLPVPAAAQRSRGRRGQEISPLVWLVIVFMVFGSRGLFFWPLLGGPRRRGRHGHGGSWGGSGWGGGGFGGGGGGFGGGGASGGW